MKPLIFHERCRLYGGDALDLGRVVARNSIDAVISDPPAGIKFMGNKWDDNKGGRKQWIFWLTKRLLPVFRALKPGGHVLLWALPRTSHWTAMALEYAGFEIKDVHHHIFGTGFPKSLNISKAIDTHLGATRPVVGRAKGAASDDTHSLGSFAADYDVTAPGSAEAATWDGFGTALKPAVEHWILARKPLIGTYAENILAHGTGALNIDGCRIGTDNAGRSTSGETFHGPEGDDTTGRWPAHLSLEHADVCVPDGHTGAKYTRRVGEKLGEDSRELAFGMGRQTTVTVTATTPRFRCVIGCPVRSLDEQSGARPTSKPGKVVRRNKSDAALSMMNSSKTDSVQVAYGDTGGASRFFYVAKGSRAEKNRGLSLVNHHPTVKSLALMRWLIRLITPPNAVVLDMFAGSGTTGVAALQEGHTFVGVELGGDNGEYFPIIEGRLNHAISLLPVKEFSTWRWNLLTR